VPSARSPGALLDRRRHRRDVGEEAPPLPDGSSGRDDGQRLGPGQIRKPSDDDEEGLVRPVQVVEDLQEWFAQDHCDTIEDALFRLGALPGSRRVGRERRVDDVVEQHAFVGESMAEHGERERRVEAIAGRTRHSDAVARSTISDPVEDERLPDPRLAAETDKSPSASVAGRQLLASDRVDDGGHVVTQPTLTERPVIQ